MRATTILFYASGVVDALDDTSLLQMHSVNYVVNTVANNAVNEIKDDCFAGKCHPVPTTSRRPTTPVPTTTVPTTPVPTTPSTTSTQEQTTPEETTPEALTTTESNPPPPPETHCPTPASAFKVCAFWGDPHFGMNFANSGDYTDHHQWRLGHKGSGGSHRIVNHYDIGNFWMFQSKDQAIQSQGFFCDARGHLNSAAAIVLQVGSDRLVFKRPAASAPAWGDHLRDGVPVGGVAEKQALELWLNGEEISYDQLGSRGLLDDNIPASGGGYSTMAWWAQQMSLSDKKTMSVGPMCAGHHNQLVSLYASVPLEQKVYEPVVVFELASDQVDTSNPNHLCNLPGGTLTPHHVEAVSAVESLFTVRELKELCHTCGMGETGADAERHGLDSNFAGCNPPTTRDAMPAITFCGTISGSIYAEAQQDCADFVAEDDWYQACMIEHCATESSVHDLVAAELAGASPV